MIRNSPSDRSPKCFCRIVRARSESVPGTAKVFESSGVSFHVELPGVDPDQVKLIAGGRVLLLVGERRRPKDGGHYQHMEIEYGPFRRQVVLGEDIDPDRASATYERGILRITLPLAAKPEPRESVSIEVKVAQ